MTTKTPPEAVPKDSSSSPVHKISISPVHVTIFKNYSNRGEFYTIQVSRIYKDKMDQFGRTSSFNPGHLEALSIAINQARAWVEDHKI